MANKIILALSLVMVCVILVYFLFIWGQKDYLDGELNHYSGSSEITVDQLLILVSEQTIGGISGSIERPEILDNGNIKVDYDFYSGAEYPFLKSLEFSYFDSPKANYLSEMWKAVLTLIGVFIFVILFAWFYNQGKINILNSDNSKRKMANAAWYMLHPKYLWKHPEAKEIYSSQIGVDININLNDAGVVCTRTWKYKDGYLYSAGIGQACWETKTLFANKLPLDGNENGVYANRLCAIDGGWESIRDILGIVSLKGEWCEHADGVVRAERCDILHLIVSKYYKSVAGKLSSVYGVPVTVTDNCINTYLNWLLKENGLDCVIHNSKIMEATDGNKRASSKKGTYTSRKTGARTSARVKTCG